MKKENQSQNREREKIYLGNPMDLQLSQAYLLWPIWSVHVGNVFGGVVPSHSNEKKSTEKLVGFALLTNSKKHQCRARVHVHCTYTIRYAMLHTNFILFRNELNSLDFQNENNYGRRFTFWPSHRINWIEWIAFTLEWVQMESMRSFLFVYWCLYLFISVFLMLALCPSFFLDLVCAPFTFNFSLIII